MPSPSNRDRVGRAFELLGQGLSKFVDRRMRKRAQQTDDWLEAYSSLERGPVTLEDPAFLLRVMAEVWNDVFRDELTRADRNVVFELRDVRNRWAHNDRFESDDTYRALDSIERLLTAVDAVEAEVVGKSKDDLMRLRYQAEVRKATPKQEALIAHPMAGLKPWREVMVPHDDVARGRFALAEFAADLHQVHQGRGSAEYADPVEFFRRTFLTDGLSTLLAGAVGRLAGQGGVPVVDLQTNFGGGKTHCQIALYHLFSGTPAHEFPQEIQDLVAAAGVALPEVRRAVVVGTKVAPGQPDVKEDGTEVRTLWGELAWQLGGREAFDLVAGADRTSTSPGDALNTLLERYAPCLILIDEWVAYARQLLGAADLPGGTFDVQFSFAQALTEAAKATSGALLVVSLPASEEADQASSDIEVGGTAGREALKRLRNVIGRVEASWRPATADESFEIVRRRLFRPIDPSNLPDRDATARVLGELYRKEANEFPTECREVSYVDKIKSAYPIHPELFARLYEDWSTLDRFQRTRGVLRLMAAVVHALWEGGDQSPIILPAMVPLAQATVAAELTRNLEDAWKPIIDADIDGPGSLPIALDGEVPNLGRYQAARRVARTVFLGSAPTWRSANRGIEPSRIRLGCALPGETLATFGDALNRLSSRATFLYTDAGRYWYGVQPSVTRTAQQRAERYLNDARDEIHDEILNRLREAQNERGDFEGVHPAPPTSAEVVDEPRARLVILGSEHPHVSRSDDSAAILAARELLERRGNAPREYRNMLVFLAADSRRLDELERGVADYLAWWSIDAEAGAEGLNLDPNQARQAATKKAESNRTVGLRLADTYQWLLVPSQPDPTGAIGWDVLKVDGQDGLAVRASRKLVSDAHLYLQFAPTLLRQRLDNELASLWGEGDVTAAAIWDAFARYVYLPRLKNSSVLFDSVARGPSSLTWQHETFATADGRDGDRYLGLTMSAHGGTVTATTLVVRPDVAAAAAPERVETEEESEGDGGAEGGAGTHGGAKSPNRFRAVVRLDPERLNRDFGKVAEEVVLHLTGLRGTHVEISVEIFARNDDGFPDAAVRTVSENARTLGFQDAEFEKE